MLAHFAAGRFAPPNHSPLRERRELFFATTPQSGNTGLPGKQEKQNESTETPGTERGREGTEGAIANIVEQSKTGSLDVLGGGSVYASLDIADELISTERISEQELRTIARTIGIAIDDSVRAERSVFEQIKDRLTPETSPAFLDKLRPLIRERLGRDPQLTLRNAWLLDDRIRKYETLERTLEQLLRIDGTIVELQNELLQFEDDNLLTDENPMMVALEDKLKERVRQAGKKESKELNEAFDKYIRSIEAQRAPGIAPVRFTDEQRTNLRIDAMLEVSRNAQKKLRGEKNTGGNQASRESPLIEKPKSYVDRLRRESKSLRAILDVQLMDRSTEMLKKHRARFERMIAAVKIPGVAMIEDVQAILRESNEKNTSQAQEFERAFLQTHGISAIALLKEFDQLQMQLRRQHRIAPWTDPEHPEEKPYALPPATGSDSFLENAKQDLAIWENRGTDLVRTGEGIERDLRAMQIDQDDTEKWAVSIADELRELESETPDAMTMNERLDMIRAMLGRPQSQREAFIAEFNDYFAVIRNYAGADDRKRKALRGQLEKCVTPMTFPGEIQSRIQKALWYLRNPGKVREALKQAENFRELAESDTEKNPIDHVIEQTGAETRKRLNAIMGILVPVRPNADPADAIKRRDLFTPLQHQVSEFLNIGSALVGREKQLEQSMDAALAEKEKDPNGTLRTLYWAESEVEKLELCKDLLDAIDREKEFAPMNDRVLAVYDRTQGKIRVNEKLRGDPRMDEAYQHERGHAILHILTERTQLFPNLIEVTLNAHRDLKNGNDQTFEQLLFGLKDFGSYAHLEEQNLPEAGRREAFTEELLVRYADWKAQRKRQFHLNELQLFDMLETGPRTIGEKADPMFAADLEKVGSFKNFRKREAQSHLEETEAAKPATETFNMKESLNDSERMLRNVKLFLNAYENDERVPRESYLVFQKYYEDGDVELQRLEKKFVDKKKWAGTRPPEFEPQDQEDCRQLEAYAKKLEKIALGYDAQRLDTTEEGRHVSLTERIFKGLRFGSINDVMKLWKDMTEDFGSIFKRRQDRLLKDVGYAITKPLQDSNLLKNLPIPWLNEYLPGLHAYHQRRYSGTETEAADKWKDGMKNEDSHTLLHFLHDTTNKDAIRGIISLLCDRGEMDWNEEGVWRTLNKISGFDMPIGPCKRSDVLRDTWLRKIVSYIWQDKELYYHWRAENDSKIKSGKEHFTAWVDQLSNVRGGMRAELQKQLNLFTEWNSHHPHRGTPPEDVKPHLYEKVIHYAIENGKMTMEDKFYYLIQGVASGILSIDRLRTLAGQEGGILNQFPFIDYFYGRNNTLPEVKALAARLREFDESGKDTCEPGAKTTMWIQLELVRDSKVLERLSKGTSRTSSETIDHEDVPLFLPQLDYNAVRGMADIISGSRQKMSPEGLKNLYCGYSSKFKVFGRLAQLDDNGKERFSGEDAKILAEAIGAYVDVDNILTRKAYEKDVRPSLSVSQLESMPVSGDGTHTTMQYRKNMNKFVLALMREIGPEVEATPEWQNFLKQNKKREEKIKEEVMPDGSTRKTKVEEQKFKLMEDYITTDLESVEGRKPPPRNNPDIAKKLFEGTPAFVEALKKILPKKVNLLKDILKRFTKEYDDADYENGFFDEGGSAGNMTYKNAAEAIEAKNKQREFAEHYQAQEAH